jgi:hypothetical protein
MSSFRPSSRTSPLPLCHPHTPTCHNRQSMPTTPTPQTLRVISPAAPPARLRPRPSRTCVCSPPPFARQ